MQRDCDICKKTDEGPRHVHAEADGTSTIRHFDCCAKDGCPDGSCDLILGGMKKKLKDEALLTYVQSGAVDEIGPQINEARAGKATA